jgi:hypothetical protein
MTPPNLVKHVATASEAAAPKAPAAPKQPSHLEFGQLPARYRRAPLTEAEMEAIEVRKHWNSMNNQVLTIIIEWRSNLCHLK